MGKRILITGAGGNVGQYIARELSENGYEVIGLYRNRKPECGFYQAVRCDLAKEEPPIEGVDVIIHAAAALHGSVQTLIQNNLAATQKLLVWAAKSKVRRMVYFSSVSVYGAADGELSETSVIMDPDPYGATKYLCERLVWESEIPEKLILELPRMLGPFVDVDGTIGSGFVAMTRKLLRGEDVTCFIPREPYNNFMHVSDLTDFVRVLLERNVWSGADRLLLGAPDRLEMMEILGIMKDEMGSSSHLTEGKSASPPRCALINISKALSCGYRPQSAEKSLRRFASEMMRRYSRSS